MLYATDMETCTDPSELGLRARCSAMYGALLTEVHHTATRMAASKGQASAEAQRALTDGAACT